MRTNPLNAFFSSLPFGINGKSMNRCVVVFLFASICILFSFGQAYSKGKKVSITSTPSKARVLIDGEFCGKTPLVLKLAPGRHRLELKKRGHNDYYDVIRVKKRKRTEINVVLESEDRFGILLIKTSPSRAGLHINGQYYDVSPVRLKLPEGEYRIRLQKTGYNVLIQKVMVYSGETNSYYYDLEPVELHGTLDLETFPHHSKVFIDDIYYEKSPLKARLFSGKHTLRIKKKGYEVYTEKIHIKGGKYHKRHIRLNKIPPPRPLKGTLRINSIPDGARVMINGEKYGRTPFETRLEAGVYDVKLRKKGYSPWQQDIRVHGRDVSRVYAQLEKAHSERRSGFLTITSRPRRAKIFIDGQYRGSTPLENVRLTAGSHRIRLSKRGFRSFKDSKKIRPGKEHRLDARLEHIDTPVQREPVEGTLSVVSKPLNAKVFVDGTYFGKTPVNVKLRPGRYSIELRHKGFKPYYQEIKVRPGDHVPVRARLIWKGFSFPFPFPPPPFPF